MKNKLDFVYIIMYGDGSGTIHIWYLDGDESELATFDTTDQLMAILSVGNGK